MSSLKFTIVTPSYNQGQFIEETICSVVDQDYDNFEYFVIDGGSTDGTVDVIKKFEKKITSWISERDKGQSHALNKGVKQATGDILIWINSDDILEKDALKKAAQYFQQHPEIDVLHGRSIIFQDGQYVIRGADARYLPEQYLSGMAFPQPSAFIRRSTMEKCHPKFNENLDFGMDYDLFVSLYLNGNFMNVPDVFSKYRLHTTSKTISTNDGFAEDWQKIFNKVIHSFDDTVEIRTALRQLSMWHGEVDSYTTTKSFEKDFLRKAFYYFLDFQISFYYQDLNISRVRQIAGFVKRASPDFYRERNMKRLYWITFVPMARYLIPLFRKSSV
jgi:glycosyltransferase involved in cell wall biosynthesis